MDIHSPLTLLGGLSPAEFMRLHWQRKPLLVRGAVPGMRPLLSRQELMALAASDQVESRLVQCRKNTWQLSHGPFERKALPSLKDNAANDAPWTLLVQGVDLHAPAVHQLLQQFRFVPDARLDDVMISFATDGGGVGPHFDSYDVFLLQVEGQRHWRIGQQSSLSLRQDVPLKILADFQPEQEWILNPGDMLYLPPRYAHDGVALGECMTYSIGFIAPRRQPLAQEILGRTLDAWEDEAAQLTVHPDLYQDPEQAATTEPARIPEALHTFARQGVMQLLAQAQWLELGLGEVLTEPKPQTTFKPRSRLKLQKESPLALHPGSRMMYDAQHVFLNGESLIAGGADAQLMHKLANQRHLQAQDLQNASDLALETLQNWARQGWIVLT